MGMRNPSKEYGRPLQTVGQVTTIFCDPNGDCLPCTSVSNMYIHTIISPQSSSIACRPTSQPTFDTHLSLTARIKLDTSETFESAKLSSPRSQLLTVSLPNIPACRLTTSSTLSVQAIHSSESRGIRRGPRENMQSGGCDKR